MRTRVDVAGRIVIPKKLRERYGLAAGSAVSIIPELPERRFIRNGPILSITTGPGTASLGDFDVDRLRGEQFGGKMS